MTVNFINPIGRENQAELTSEQVEILRNLDGYTVLGVASDPFSDDSPAVSSKVKVYGAGEENPKVCTTSCEG